MNQQNCQFLFLDETNKDISKRLGIMWKNLPPDMKETFYEDAKKAEEEHNLKYPK